MRLLLMFILILTCLAAVGCTNVQHQRPAWASFNPNDWPNRSEKDTPILLDVTGAIAIDVESFNGDVVITGNPNIRQASVQIVKEGVQGYKRTKEAKESLVDISATVEIVGGEMGQVLQVRTSTTNPEPYYQRAHVIMEVPQIDGVSVHTHNGKVYVTNIAGAVDISTDDGEVRVMSNQAMLKPVTIVNRNGDINYRVRGESTGRLDCQTIDGRVFQLVRYGRVKLMEPTDRTTLNATLNDGTNLIRLRTVKGDIRIAVVSNPEQVGEKI